MPTVALVIDSEDLLIALSNDLSKSFRVIACTPESVNAVLAHEKPDALVLDLFLTGTDGFSLLKECRHILPDAVLLLTPFVSSYALDSAASLGVGFIISKPFRLACVREHLLDMTSLTDNGQNRSTIQEQLLNLGISPKYTGYDFLCMAVEQLARDQRQLLKEIYPDIAKAFNTQTYAVERNIRTAIRRAWENQDDSVWNYYFPNTKKCPSNKEFISCLAARR